MEGGGQRGGGGQCGGGISERGVGGLVSCELCLGVADFFWGILVYCGSEGGVWASGRGYVSWMVSMTKALTFKNSGGRRLSPGNTQPSNELRPEAGRSICRLFSILIVPAWSTKRSRNRRQHWLPQNYTCRPAKFSFQTYPSKSLHIIVA